MSMRNLFSKGPSAILDLFSSAKPPTEQLPRKTVYEYNANTIKKEPFSFEQLRGKVVLIVNVASFCGKTPQYEGLQKLYDTYKDKGLEIIGFPCNQFLYQEPNDGDAIQTFCSKNYGVTFRLMEKIDVNGSKAHPLYQFIKKEKAGSLGFEGISWNFEKFLIDRNGFVYERYSPSTQPADLIKDIEKLLAEEAKKEEKQEPAEKKAEEEEQVQEEEEKVETAAS